VRPAVRARARALAALAREVEACRRCPRLVEYREAVARQRRRSYRDWQYWGKPVPGFGDPNARLLVVGLAPAAHGANRTGRMFTGDRSGDWLYRALYTFGFANQPVSLHRRDGLKLKDAYVTAAVRCAPPGNRPAPEEVARCREFLAAELRLLHGVRVVVALGHLAFRAYLAARAQIGAGVPSPRPRFAHGAVVDLGGVRLLGSYHPSQQNTFTGKLTRAAFHRVFRTAARLLDEPAA
jgi:uracil-DNA glycosylase family 4